MIKNSLRFRYAMGTLLNEKNGYLRKLMLKLSWLLKENGFILWSLLDEVYGS